MWHELVLNGIGGRTIAEAKRNLSYPEFCRWAQFRKRRGSLHTGMRLEESFGRWMANYFNFNSKNSSKKPTDFMPHYIEPPITLDQAMEQWR
ncbi:hypothetical protein G8770_03535 [Aestuariicella hydrocarbonica]|uniref:Minor tail T domain-containing protein n=1 Tax=Pseudomaricurvus hydrocarbonicus TaxID=1470433 RepID=A0A9E5JQ72_9GAMM|nr:hypothetical protein [Aestuariicella hydrocarbonica]